MIMNITWPKIRTVFLLLFLYLVWIILILLALPLILIDPIKQRLLQPLVHFWGKSSLKIMGIPVKVSGMENLEELDKAVLVINHTSAVDIPLILGYLPLRVGFLAKKQVMYIPLIGQIFLLMGHVVIDRSNARKALKSIKRCIKAYNRGISIALFPEGTRTPDGRVQPFKAGSLRIPVEAEAQVVPVSIYGGHRVMRKNDLTMHKHPVYLHVGKPISAEGVTKKEFRSFVEKLEERVRTNTEQLRKQMLADYPELSGDDTPPVQ